MKRFIVSVLFLMMTVGVASAQHWSVGFGYSQGLYFDYSENHNIKPILGLGYVSPFGSYVEAKYTGDILKDKLFYEVGVNYTMHSTGMKFIEDYSTPWGISLAYRNKYESRIYIPANVKYMFARVAKCKFFVFGGPELKIGIHGDGETNPLWVFDSSTEIITKSNNIRPKGSILYYYEKSWEDSNPGRRFDLSANVGVSFMFNDRVSINIMGRHDFLGIFKPNQYGHLYDDERLFSTSLGVAFHF